MKIQVIRRERGIVVVKQDGMIKNVKPAELRRLERDYLLEAQNEECAVCHINMPEVLAVHHIDGHHENDDLNNLKLLCFNCHFLTHMRPRDLYKMGDWRGRPILEIPDDLVVSKIVEALSKVVPHQESCLLHEDRPSSIVVGFDPATGENLPQDKYFGACSECWQRLAEVVGEEDVTRKVSAGSGHPRTYRLKEASEK